MNVTIDLQGQPPLTPRFYAPEDGRPFVTLNLRDNDVRVAIYFSTRDDAYQWLIAAANDLAVASSRDPEGGEHG